MEQKTLTERLGSFGFAERGITMNKRGRPVKEDSKRGKFQLRLSEEDEAMLDYIRKDTGETKAEAFRKGLKAYYHLVKTRNMLY